MTLACFFSKIPAGVRPKRREEPKARLSLTKCPAKGSDKVYFSWGNKWWQNYEGGNCFAKVYIAQTKVVGNSTIGIGIYWTGGWVGFNSTIPIGQSAPVYAFLMDLNEEEYGPPSPSKYEFRVGWQYNCNLNYENLYVKRETEAMYRVISDHLDACIHAR